MKQTAMQEHIEWLKATIEIAEEQSPILVNALKLCLNDATHRLAMEKEQIIDAVVNTVKIGTEKENVLLFTSEDEIIIRNEAEDYYNETFKSE